MILDNVLPPHVRDGQWYKLHGIQRPEGTYLRCECSKLKDGLCTIHATKPRTCVEYKPGGPDCRRVVKLMRPGIATEIEKRF